MFGRSPGSSPESSGIIPLTFSYLLTPPHLPTPPKLKLSYIEIYNEQVYDLLHPSHQTLQLIEDPLQGGVVVQDLTELEVVSFEQAEGIIAKGNAQRAIAETRLNEASSRSHAIVMIGVETRAEGGGYYVAKLSLVDLAGSERQSVHHETRGIRTFEGSNINRSLLTLGNCINILS
jgi:hypothetical protein